MYKGTGGTITCCSSGGQTGVTTASPLDAERLPISIPSDDPVYKDVTCMNFVRSKYGLYLNGTTPPSREQVKVSTNTIVNNTFQEDRNN